MVGSDGKVQLRPITIGRDYGTTLEIVGGVDVNDRIIVNPSDSIEDGQQVNVAPRAPGRPAVVKRYGAWLRRPISCWLALLARMRWWARIISGRRRLRPLRTPTRRRRRGAWPRPKIRLPKGAWWEVFNDAELNDYEQQLLTANQSLLAAKDRLDEARSLARVASARILPASQRRSQRLAQHAIREIARKCVTIGRPLTQSTYEIPFFINYEPDLFGKFRRSLQASNATLQATAADMYNVQPGADRGAGRRLLQPARA